LDRARVLELLRQVSSNELSPEDAIRRLSMAPFESLDFATIDHHRALRQGYPEVVYGEGKNSQQVVAIAERILEHGRAALVTRTNEATRQALQARFPDAVLNDLARTVRIGAQAPTAQRPTLLIITAGTSDLPVAEEAAESAIAMGNSVARLNDVGVAGIHRLLAQGDARRFTLCRRRARSQPGHRRPHEYRLRRESRRAGGAIHDAELVRRGRDRCEHRQWLRGRCGGDQDPESGLT
jgi:NCAIR mutase (PurE)-related protein